MDIRAGIEQLGLDVGSYCVIGGGVLQAYGLREAHDLDILLAEKVFTAFSEQEGWEHLTTKSGSPYLHRDGVELYQDLWIDNFRPETLQVLARADVIDGVAYLSIPDCIAMKTAKGREKDLKDIELLKNLER